MKSKTYRLDRFITKNSEFSKSEVRLLVAQKRIYLDECLASSVDQIVSEFSTVVLDGVCLQSNEPVYIMLNKPKGFVSATHDDQHKTVLDLIDHPKKSELHIVGRLDFNTTGLLLLTNDGAWSRRISLPESSLVKIYEVTLSKPLNEEYIVKFQQGFYFEYEKITTAPAKLDITSPYTARLSIVEGKYHQVKRMFGYFQNKVLALHRIQVGDLSLGDLELGESRVFTPA